MEYEYRSGSNAAHEHATSTTFTEYSNTTNQRTTCYWFTRSRSGNIDLKNEPRGRPKNLVDNDELKAIVEADDTQSTAKLAAAFDFSVKTILSICVKLARCVL
ncbi:unnamed protein product [Spodoptera littoralis]|uniref:Uncharacterized protein n=1 Tax=Spodoptera littoralis TaxID=7109 RepID=A0A9P0HZH8_SPOLI|nr:unnamed protein product [Spodoptera littoralis]CAH1636645.1 unnamed protein product [Spodoptera littoralis]